MKLEPRERFKRKRSECFLEKKGVIYAGAAVLLKLHRPKRGINLKSIKTIRFFFHVIKELFHFETCQVVMMAKLQNETKIPAGPKDSATR